MRYVAAIVVACAMSLGVFQMLLFTVALRTGTTGFIIVLLVVGFSGVFSGAHCLPRANRRFGSIVLLILGLAFALFRLIGMSFLWGGENSFPYIWLLPLAVGGGVAVYVFHRQPPSTALEPTAATPSVSDAPSNPKTGGDSTSSPSGGGSALDH